MTTAESDTTPVKIRMIIAAVNADGEPDLTFCIVVTRQCDWDAGFHYEEAARWAREQGYEEPMVVFDERDPGGKALLDKFVWESADEVVLDLV